MDRIWSTPVRLRRPKIATPTSGTKPCNLAFPFLRFLCLFAAIKSSLALLPGFLRGRFIQPRLLRLITSGQGSKTDCDPIPAVNGRNGERQVDEFDFTKMFAHSGKRFVRSVGFGNVGCGLAPGQCGSFAVGVERRFAPGIQGQQSLRGFAVGQCILAMLIDTIGAAIDL